MTVFLQTKMKRLHGVQMSLSWALHVKSMSEPESGHGLVSIFQAVEQMCLIVQFIGAHHKEVVGEVFISFGGISVNNNPGKSIREFNSSPENERPLVILKKIRHRS